MGAESLNFKLYTYTTKTETFSVDDVEGHIVMYQLRGTFYVFENGEVATASLVATGDFIKMAGPFMNYVTIKFEDGSTIIIKNQGTIGGSFASGGWTGEIIKGTGRFAGVKGTLTAKTKYLPVEKGEAGLKGIGEGTLNYTLPSK